MSTGSKKKRRSDRVTSVELPPGLWGNLWGHLRRGHVLVRLALCAVAAIAAVGDHPGLGAAAAVSLGDVPPRDIVARTQFEKDDDEATRKSPRTGRKSGGRRLRPGPDADWSSCGPSWKTTSANWWPPKTSRTWTRCGANFELPLAEGTPEPTDEERQQQFQTIPRSTFEARVRSKRSRRRSPSP